MNNVLPVILGGGNGTRLWPLSRSGFPKQFLCLQGELSLCQQTVQRINRLAFHGVQTLPPVVVTNEQHRFIVQEQLFEIGQRDAKYILEPEAKNTAPALTLAALAAIEEGEDPIMFVSPADQVINDSQACATAFLAAIRAASRNEIVTLGVTPTRPETGYGYLEHSKNLSENETHVLRSFVEKPNKSTAQEYINAETYSWNSGIFVLKASVWISAIKRFSQSIHDLTVASWSQREQDGQFIRPNAISFGAVPEDSIDYAVMEKCPNSEIGICMVRMDAGWSDLGAWDAVWDAAPKNKDENSGTGDVLFHEVERCHVNASSRLVALTGVSELVVIETPDAVLVANKSDSQNVKEVVSKLKKSGRTEHLTHRKVHRPWGWYDRIDKGARFQVKRICVKPGASLSLQKHHHRAEHWIVVEGTAEVTCGDETFLLSENQSTYIPIGTVHRLKNPGKLPLEMIEVQSGSYLGEDDIVRLEDTYGRVPDGSN